MGGALDYFAGLLAGSRRRKKRKQFQTVELKVRMDCEGCERKVKKALSSMKGIFSSPLLLLDARILSQNSCSNILSSLQPLQEFNQWT